jgi:hypothetical protein
LRCGSVLNSPDRIKGNVPDLKIVDLDVQIRKY